MLRAAIVMVVAAVAFAGCEVTEDSVRSIGVERAAELKQKQDSDPLASLFIDPRPGDAFQAVHIPGAVNRSLAAFDGAKGIDPRISQYGAIVVYGENRGDPIASAVAKRMMQIGYSDVYSFAGGIDEWTLASLPLESGPGRPLPAIANTSRRGVAR